MDISRQHWMSCFPVAMIKAPRPEASYGRKALFWLMVTESPSWWGRGSSKRQAWWPELAAERPHLQSQTGSKESNMEAEQGYKVSKLAPSDTLCPARLKCLPKQCYHLGTSSSNNQVYGWHFPFISLHTPRIKFKIPALSCR